MRAKALKSLLQKAVEERLPVLVTGAPGVGKSDIVAQAAKAAGADLMVSHPVVSDPTDAKGLPWAEPGAQEARFLPFGDLARAMKAKKPLVWFLDDLGQAAPAVQASYMQLLLARRINGHALPECVTFISATNRRTDRAGVVGILEPVKSRFATIVELEVNAEDWIEWAVLNNIAPEVIAFIRFTGGKALHEFTPSADMRNNPSPRTWTFVSRLLGLGLRPEDEFAVFSGAVGEGRAAEFCSFLKQWRELPSIEEILDGPERAPVPNEASVLCALSTALARAATQKNLDAVLTYAERLPQEYGVLCMVDALRRNRSLTASKAWLRYINGPLGQAVMGKL